MSRWTEEEVKTAIDGYFRLLESEHAGKKTNKAEIYRSLSSRCPSRTPKAFERKFQNISAILYDLHLPYVSGLKPLGNYQRLLKLVALDRLEKSPLPAVEPYEILESKLREIAAKPIKVADKGSGRYGLAIERALGIDQNNSKSPDFMGIELKTKSDNSLQTLFSRAPSKYLSGTDKYDFFNKFCYVDSKRKRRALCTSFSSRSDTLGFSLAVDHLSVKVLNRDSAVLEYYADYLEMALLSKHSQTVFLKVIPDDNEVSVMSATFCRSASIIRFLELVENGQVFLDFTMSELSSGKIKDHGFLWRIHSEALRDLYLFSSEMEIHRDRAK